MYKCVNAVMADACTLDWIEQGLTSHSTHFRSFRRRWGDCGSCNFGEIPTSVCEISCSQTYYMITQARTYSPKTECLRHCSNGGGDVKTDSEGGITLSKSYIHTCPSQLHIRVCVSVWWGDRQDQPRCRKVSHLYSLHRTGLGLVLPTRAQQ